MILRLILIGILVLSIPTKVYASDSIDVPVTATYNPGKYVVTVNDRTYKTSVTICAEEGYNTILTEEQKEQVKTGHDIETDIYIRKSTEEEESVMIETVDTITKDNIAYSIDIAIVNTIDGETFKVSEIKEPIEFNIDVSEIYDSNKEYKLISRHNKSSTEYIVRVLNYEYDMDTETITFMSDKFSTFSLIDISDESGATEESSEASSESSQTKQDNTSETTINQNNSQDTNNQSDAASTGAQINNEVRPVTSLKTSEQSTITENVKSIVSVVTNYLTGDNSREHILCVVVIIVTGLIIVVRLKRREWIK